MATSPSPLESRWQHLQYQNLHRNTSSPYTAPGYPFIETFDGGSLEAALTRLSLSTFHQSPFIPPPPPSLDGFIGSPMLGNPLIDPLIGQGYQQIQQAAFELQRLRIQNALRSPSVAADSFETFALPRFNRTAISNDPFCQLLNGRGVVPSATTSENGYGKLPSSTFHEFTNRFPMRPCSNGFRLDSEGHYRGVALNGPVSELDNSNILRAPLYNRPRKYSSLVELRGWMLAVAKDQQGCRFLQRKLEEGRAEEIEMIFLEVKDHVNELMVDPFGNYLVQKLLEVCSEGQRMEVLFTVTFDLVDICLNAHGTCAVQKLLEHLTTPQQISCVMSALRPGTVKLSKSSNGQHVIQHCVEHFSYEDNKYLLNTIADHCVEIATDRIGCCVMQHCVEHAQGESRERLVAEIAANALLLAQDSFGNYVVQYTLGKRIPHVTADILRQLEGSYLSLSLEMCSSNVVEKSLKESGEEQSTRIIKELLSSPYSFLLLQHPYGNYVIQTALLVSKGPTYNALVCLVREHSSSMQSNLYGRNILRMIKGSMLQL